jgi:hypothetical protein
MDTFYDQHFPSQEPSRHNPNKVQDWKERRTSMQKKGQSTNNINAKPRGEQVAPMTTGVKSWDSTDSFQAKPRGG